MTEYKSQDVELTGSCRAGIAWDFIDQEVDLDMSVLALTGKGRLIDAAYYNNKSICDETIVHSGDVRDGYQQGDDEYVDIELDDLPNKVKVVFFLVNVFEGGNFRDVKNVTFTLYDKKKSSCYSDSFGKFSKTGYIIGAMYRVSSDDSDDDASAWKFKPIKKQCTGKNFEQSMPIVTQRFQESIQDLLESNDDSDDETNDPKKTYDLKKDETYFFAKEIVQITIGLGWDPSNMNQQIDVDAGVVLLTEDKEKVDIVHWNNLKYKSQVIHKGDNLTGDGDGDDERIDLHLYKIDREICYMGIGICVYTQGVSFKEIKNCFVRLINNDGSNHELCKFNISGNYKSNAMIMGYLYRNLNGGWGFKSCGVPSTGTMIKHLLKPVQNIVKNGKTPNKDTYEKVKKEGRKYKEQNNIN